MRLSFSICLLIIVLCITFSSAKKKSNPPGNKNRPSDAGKNKGNVNKQVKKKDSSDEDEKSEKEEEESDELDEEDDEEEEEEEDGDVDEEDDEDDDEDDDDDDDEESSDDEDQSDEEDDDEEDDDEELGKNQLTFLYSGEFKGETRKEMKKKGIFYNIEDIKKFFRGPDFQGYHEVEDMLRKFNSSEMQVQAKWAANPDHQAKPFYVIEGVNPATRTKVAQILAHRLKGLYLVNQPRILLGPVLQQEWAKRAYYAFSKYTLANKVKMTTFSKPAVTERYWMDHASFIMAKTWEKATDLPKAGSEIYKFPEDLPVPNVTFVIFNTPPPRLGKQPSKMYLFEQRMLVVYKRFTGAKIHIIRFPESAKKIADKIDIYMHNKGYKTYTPPKYFDIQYEFE